MSHLALDMSKASTGFALWAPGWQEPRCGNWELGSSLTGRGRVFLRLHRNMNDIHVVTPLMSVTYELPIYLGGFNVRGSADNHFLMVGLAAHVESYCDAKGIRICRGVHQATWRRHMFGKIGRRKSPDLKRMAMQACWELGLRPHKHDEAEAIGILDYQLHIEGITPPWRQDRILTAPIGD